MGRQMQRVLRVLSLGLISTMIGFLIPIAIGAGTSQGHSPHRDNGQAIETLTPSQKMSVVKRLQNVGAGPFYSSLEMKGNVDFLLTPALLMQDVVSPGVVVSYPSE